LKREIVLSDHPLSSNLSAVTPDCLRSPLLATLNRYRAQPPDPTKDRCEQAVRNGDLGVDLHPFFPKRPIVFALLDSKRRDK
jgi:hypothetical protein